MEHVIPSHHKFDMIYRCDFIEHIKGHYTSIDISYIMKQMFIEYDLFTNLYIPSIAYQVLVSYVICLL